MPKQEKATPNLPANFDEMMKAKARMYKETVASVSQGQFISFKGGVLSVDGSPIKDNKLPVVVVDFMLENNFYAGKYNPNNTKPPSCYAIGRKADEMVPHEESADPQAASCAECPHNEWGSAEEGRGKACKNGARVALMSADGLNAKIVPQSEVRFAKVPVTSMRPFAAFVKNSGEVLGKLPFQLITELAVVPDPKNQFSVQWNLQEEIKDKALQHALYTRHEQVSKTMNFGYPKPEEAPPAGKAKGGKTAERPKARKF
jgi:hypothetical protein